MRSIRLKLTTVVAALVLVTVVGLSLAAYWVTRRTLRDQIHARLSVVTSDRQKLVQAFLQLQEERVRLVASRTRLRALVEELAQGAGDGVPQRAELRRILTDAAHSARGVREIAVLDLAGAVLATTAEENKPAVRLSGGLIGEAKTKFGLELHHSPDGTDEAVICAPITVMSGSIAAVVAMVVEAESLERLLVDRNGLGETGEILLGTRRGDLLEVLIGSQTPERTVVLPARDAPALLAAVGGAAGFLETEDFRGVRVLAAYQPVGYGTWGLVTKIDAAEAYAPINTLRNMFIVIELGVLGLAVVSAFWLATRFTRPITRISKMAESIAAGSLHAQVVVETTDEIGQLARSFNRMSEELAHSYAILEERVQVRTAELEAERDLLRVLMDHTPDRIYFKDLQSRFVRTNLALAEFFNTTPAAIIGKTDFDVFSEEHARQAFEDEQKIIRTGQPIIGVEEKETWPDGRVTWASTTKAPWRDAAGQLIGTFGISRDITDRRRAEEQLERYFTLSPDLFCIAGFDGYFKRLSSTWATTLGYTTEELLAQPYLELVHPEDRPATINEAARLNNNARTVQFENRYRCKDGSYRWLQWNAIPVLEQNLIHAVARDVSEHKRAQELLARFADALNRRNQEMQEDLKMAREVHQVFVPSDYPSFPANVPPGQSLLRFAHRYLPTSTLGGDFFDILPVSDTEAGILLCDVMGHGMRAALVTSILRGLVDKHAAHAGDPSRFLAEINHGLVTHLKNVNATIFATAVYLVLDVRTGRVRAANAGHPAPVIIRPAARMVERLNGADTHGPALGLMASTDYPTTHDALQPKDRLLLFTDGIFEVEGGTGDQYGIPRLVEAVRRRATTDLLPLLDELLLDSRNYSARGEFTDDVCLVSVELAGLLPGPHPS